MIRRALFLLLACLPPPAAAAGERLAGPVAATVEEVVDGDTLAVRARIWIGQDVRVLVRLRGVDAPERRGRCLRERTLAAAARAKLGDLVAGRAVFLSAIETDKYGGRVVADVATEAGASPASALVAAGLARRYDGGARQPWCPALAPIADDPL
jgi:endonuclease YncB( thermonuclease family)